MYELNEDFFKHLIFLFGTLHVQTIIDENLFRIIFTRVVSKFAVNLHSYAKHTLLLFDLFIAACRKFEFQLCFSR